MSETDGFYASWDHPSVYITTCAANGAAYGIGYSVTITLTALATIGIEPHEAGVSVGLMLLTGLVGGAVGGAIMGYFMPRFLNPVVAVASTSAGVAVALLADLEATLGPSHITPDALGLVVLESIALGTFIGLFTRTVLLHNVGIPNRSNGKLHAAIIALGRRRKPTWIIRRREEVSAQEFRDDWRRILHANVPAYAKLNIADKAELERQIMVFLSEKTFEGCGGLEINDEIKVTVAAHACTLSLHMDADFYPKLRSILVYPQSYVPKRPTVRMLHESDRIKPRLGESWRAGVVVLSWEAIKAGSADPDDGHNVVYHEFAHQLDQEGGPADGLPLLLTIDQYNEWKQVLQREYERHCERFDDGTDLVLDGYGITNRAEFFAVATECFFEKPAAMEESHPDLYRLLREYYGQDPRA